MTDPVITLWGRPTSINVQKVLWALDEFGLEYRHEIVGGKYGGTDTPQYQAMSPTRRVPVLQDGAQTVWESHAILRHLVRRQPSHPLGGGDMGNIDCWLEFGATTLQPSFIGLFYQKVRMTPAERNAATEAGHKADLGAAFAVLSRGLSDGRAHLAGAAFSLADIAVGCMLYRIEAVAPDLLESAPLVAAWHKRLAERPAYARHIATSFEELRPGGGA